MPSTLIAVNLASWLQSCAKVALGASKRNVKTPASSAAVNTDCMTQGHASRSEKTVVVQNPAGKRCLGSFLGLILSDLGRLAFSLVCTHSDFLLLATLSSDGCCGAAVTEALRYPDLVMGNDVAVCRFRSTTLVIFLKLIFAGSWVQHALWTK